jgi:hypothetical protein
LQSLDNRQIENDSKINSTDQNKSDIPGPITAAFHGNRDSSVSEKRKSQNERHSRQSSAEHFSHVPRTSSGSTECKSNAFYEEISDHLITVGKEIGISTQTTVEISAIASQATSNNVQESLIPNDHGQKKDCHIDR